MTLHIVQIWLKGSEETFGLHYGKAVPIKRATVYPHPSSAKVARDAFVEKCKRNEDPVPKVRVTPYREVKHLMKG
jgi:hypothetical protein